MKRLLPLLAFLFPSLYAVPPTPLQNYCPVVIVNSTTLPASSIYFVAHGNDPNGIPCFLVPGGGGVCSYQYPTPSGAPSSTDASVQLSSLPSATGTSQTDPAYLIYIPINSASRAYFSVNKPMYLTTALNPALGVLAVDDASVTTLTDPNYYTFYQDMEFGLVPKTLSQTLLYLNLSYVDYFCLPMHLTSYSYPSNTEIKNDAVMPSGFLPSVTRESIVGVTNTALSSGQTASGGWSALGLTYYTDPYTSSTNPSYLRILAAKNSIGLGSSSTPFQGAKVPQQFFPSTYAQNTTAGPSSGKSFMETVFTYYTTNTFYFQIFPAANSDTLSSAIYSMASTGSSTLTFTAVTPGAPTPITLDLSSLSTEQLLSGSVWPFGYSGSGATPLTAFTNEISKLISALFTIGYFPYNLTTSSSSPFVNNTAGFIALAYFANPLNYQDGPWFNLYDKIFHPQFVSHGAVSPQNPNLGLAYAYDFDDLLNMSGIINGMEVQDQYGNPSTVTGSSQPYVVVTLGSLSGTIVPDISTDTYSYPVTVGSAPNGVEVSFTYFNGVSTVTTPASLTENTSLGSVSASASHPFLINFTFNSVVYTYAINLQRQIVTPQSLSSTFSAIDKYFQGSVTFTVSGPQGTPSFLIEFISSPPPWPG